MYSAYILQRLARRRSGLYQNTLFRSMNRLTSCTLKKHLLPTLENGTLPIIWLSIQSSLTSRYSRISRLLMYILASGIVVPVFLFMSYRYCSPNNHPCDECHCVECQWQTCTLRNDYGQDAQRHGCRDDNCFHKNVSHDYYYFILFTTITDFSRSTCALNLLPQMIFWSYTTLHTTALRDSGHVSCCPSCMFFNTGSIGFFCSFTCIILSFCLSLRCKGNQFDYSIIILIIFIANINTYALLI